MIFREASAADDRHGIPFTEKGDAAAAASPFSVNGDGDRRERGTLPWYGTAAAGIFRRTRGMEGTASLSAARSCQGCRIRGPGVRNAENMTMFKKEQYGAHVLDGPGKATGFRLERTSEQEDVRRKKDVLFIFVNKITNNGPCLEKSGMRRAFPA